MGKYTIAVFLAFYSLACTNGLAATVKDDKKQENIFLREDAVLSDKGDFSGEVGIFFQRDSRNLRDNSSGQQFLENGETITLSPTIRYGLNQRTELSISAPYQRRQNEYIDQNDLTVDFSDSGWGDVAVSFKHQLWYEHGNYPDLIINLSADSDNGDIDMTGGPSLGSGFWEYTMSVLAAKSLDPAIYFLHLGYQYTDSEEIDGTLWRPGDTFQYRIGAGYALSARVILSFQLTGDIVQESQVGQRRLPSEHQISFQFANTILVGRNSFIEPLISFGLTHEAPDVLFGLSFPIMF